VADENPVNYGTPVEVINRTSRTLVYYVDGRRYELKSGKNIVLDFHINFAAEQNMLPGSRDPQTPSRFQSLIGVEGKSDCSEIPDEFFAAAPVEGLDRTLMPPQKQHTRISANPDMPRRRVGVADVTEGMIGTGVAFGGNRD
jgi:hypothetical protein